MAFASHLIHSTTLWNNVYHRKNVRVQFSSIHLNMIARIANYFVLRFPKCNHKKLIIEQCINSVRKKGRKAVVRCATHQAVAFEIRCSHKIVAFTAYLWIISSKKGRAEKKRTQSIDGIRNKSWMWQSIETCQIKVYLHFNGTNEQTSESSDFHWNREWMKSSLHSHTRYLIDLRCCTQPARLCVLQDYFNSIVIYILFIFPGWSTISSSSVHMHTHNGI